MLRTREIRIRPREKTFFMRRDYRKAMSDLAKDIVVRKYFEHRQAERENTLARRIKKRIFFKKKDENRAEVIDVFNYLKDRTGKK